MTTGCCVDGRPVCLSLPGCCAVAFCCKSLCRQQRGVVMDGGSVTVPVYVPRWLVKRGGGWWMKLRAPEEVGSR